MAPASVRFAVFNDLHAQWAPGATEPGYPGANERADWLLAQVAPGGALADIDFVVAAGDLIHGENLAAITAEMAELKKRVVALPVPFYPCCGNHEIRESEGDAAYEAPYRAAFGADAFDYAIPAGAAEIIVLNNGGTFHVTASRREARYDAFKRMLTARPEVPKIVVCHVPLVPVRDRDVLRESFGFRTYNTVEAELLDLLDVHGGAVRLVVSGHLHLTGAVERCGVKHLVVSGTASFPHDYAVVAVTRQAIEVEVRSLPENLHEPASNIHGTPRYARDYTDAAHPTAAGYLRGNAAERRFLAPLGARPSSVA
jgi:3',5'-cyclic AMP phosphodiesterase CpdA